MKENKNLGCAEQTATFDMAADRLLSVTANGVEAASADHFVAAVGDATERLRSIAWGIPLRQTADTHWGTVGNWPLWKEYRRHVGRYLVTPDGEARKLNPSHSGYYVDGSAVDESEGNVMVVAPKLHVRVIDDPLLGCPVVWMSQQPLGGFALANAGGEWNCYAAYKGAMDGSKLVSRSGLTPIDENVTILRYWNCAQANGNEWGLMDYDGYRLYQLLCLCECLGNTDIQSVLGYGLKGSGTPATIPLTIKRGATKSLGDATANIPVDNLGTDSCHVSVCGFENVYNECAECVQGIYASTGIPKTAYIYKGNRIPTTEEIAATPQGEYRVVERMVVDGFITKMSLGEHLDFLPTYTGGASSSYYCDSAYGQASGQTVTIGDCKTNNGSSGGPFSIWTLHRVTNPQKMRILSSRLGYYGHLTFE